METKIDGFIKAVLREFYKDDGTICLGCMFYYRHMKRYDAPAIIKAYGLRDEEYSYGQKACIKNKNFTYFNGTCMSFTKTPGTQYAQSRTFK